MIDKDKTKAEDMELTENTSTDNNTEGTPPPWYKQFWPWFIFGLPGLVVIAGISTVIIAVKGADSIVSDSYYKEGLAINKVVEDINQAKAINLIADINIDVSIWQVKLSAEQAIDTEQITIELHHPADSNLDTSFTLFSAGNNTFRGTLSDTRMNRWYIDIFPKRVDVRNAELALTTPQHHWRLKGEIDISAPQTRIKAR